MVAPNTYTQFLALQSVIPREDLYKVVIENNASGQPIYVGKSKDPAALTSDPVWELTHVIYDGSGYLINVNLPLNGQGFKYIWDNRATYF